MVHYLREMIKYQPSLHIHIMYIYIYIFHIVRNIDIYICERHIYIYVFEKTDKM